jgi:hypothetical protein
MVVPAIPAVQYNTVVETNKSQIIQQLKSIDFASVKQPLKNNILNKFFQQFKEVLKNEVPKLGEKFLYFLLACALLAYIITYTTGRSLDLFVDTLLYFITLGRWEFSSTTDLTLIPSDIIGIIIDALYEIGMKLYGWPYPFLDIPGYHRI